MSPEEQALEAELKRRIAEAEADPSIMVPYEEVQRRIEARIQEHLENRNLSPSGPD